MNRSWINQSLIGVGCIGWVITLGSEPSLLVPLNYGLLVAGLIGLTRESARKRPENRRIVLIAGTVISALLVILYARADRYTVVWTSEDGTRYTDIHQRWSDKVIKRSMFLKEGGWASGGMAGDGKTVPHGKWTFLTRGSFDYVFYWYGEEITEGEWHLRNR